MGYKFRGRNEMSALNEYGSLGELCGAILPKKRRMTDEILVQ